MAELKEGMRFSFSVLVNRVTALQEDHVKEERVRTLLEAQCEYLQEQLNDARAHIEAYRSKIKDLLRHSKEEEDQLHGKVSVYLVLLLRTQGHEYIVAVCCLRRLAKPEPAGSLFRAHMIRAFTVHCIVLATSWSHQAAQLYYKG